MKRTRWEASFDKRKAMNTAEAAGEVADSMEYRTALMNRVHAGEITLEQAQAELIRSMFRETGLSLICKP